MSANASSGHDKDDFSYFKKWLFSLDRTDLLNAMEFTFQGPGSGGGSQDYDLLLEMTMLQTPPSTPIHPKAMGYKPRSQFGPHMGHPQGTSRLRKTQPRLFQLSARQILRPRARKGRLEVKYDVIARKKVSPWGEVYSLGCTEEQRCADEAIVVGTHIRRPEGSQPMTTFRKSMSSQEIIRMLQVASRGHFLEPLGKSSIPFCTAWLMPTERWFSLSYYLASRYQVSLLKSFAAQTRMTRSAEIDYDPRVLQKAIPVAVGRALRCVLAEDRTSLNYLRDSLLWSSLSLSRGAGMKVGSDENWYSIWQSLAYIPLLELQEPTGLFKTTINSTLNVVLAVEMQKSILEEAPKEPRPVAKPYSAKRKKKKSKRRHRGGHSGKVRDNQHSASDDAVSHFERSTLSSITEQPLAFPANDTSPQVRNRNIITVLTILEEIVEAAFVEAGLEPTPPFEQEEANRPQRALPPTNPRDGRAIAPEPHKDIEMAQTGEHNESGQLETHDMSHSGSTPSGPALPAFVLNQINVPTFQWSYEPPVDQRHSQSPFTPITASNEAPFYRPLSEEFSFAKNSVDSGFDGWSFMNRHQQAREQSILSEFFISQKERTDNEDDDEGLMVASTAASISSSTYKDTTVFADADDIDKVTGEGSTDDGGIGTSEEDLDNLRSDEAVDLDDLASQGSAKDTEIPTDLIADLTGAEDHEERVRTDEGALNDDDTLSPVSTTELSPATPDSRSVSPQAPVTPPPTLSPILVSLADLRDLNTSSLTPERLSRSKEASKLRSHSPTGASGSLPSSPIPPPRNGLSQSWSKDDIRINSFRDDQVIKQRRWKPQSLRASEFPQSYRAAAIKSLAKPIASSKGNSVDFRSLGPPSSRRDYQRDSCAVSETAVEGQREEQYWQGDGRKSDELESKSLAKDETTTITSALSHREPEELATLREERNTYRDMCLTLGAEVSMLKAMLATQQANAAVVPYEYQDSSNYPFYRPGSFDPTGMPPFFHGMKRGQRLGPMSDAGLQRGGDHESQVSEDEVYDTVAKARVDVVRRLSSNATLAGSDLSVDFNNSNSALHGGPSVIMPVNDSLPVNSLQSRLAKDIYRFLDTVTAQLKKQDSKRQTAVVRFTRLVNTIWPRAQVKLYGSHISRLCLPSSDLDFVICLPAVHKNAPALAPGVLEGRNAINETSQQVLERELKGESWIDPRSIKLIDRTVVPVIKVSTKDTRARVIQLDVSFDSPEHHGLQANEMVAQILEELPLVRPLMLVLKQFLLDLGLLTAYTGGLSSYCLFLMVARYIQEQPQSVRDCGSLLMGFLDFYGNHFDPRATGISVGRREYFARRNDYHAVNYPAPGEPPMWTPPPHTPPHVATASPTSVGPPHDFLRRNSFSDTGSVDGNRRNQRPPRFQAVTAAHRFVPHKQPRPTNPNNEGKLFGRGRPFTFDPLFVEDPLSSRNNVGRNAFRFIQVQRAFSDGHRALVASLEWDINSSGELNDGLEYPLLKCLLRSDDVLYEL